MKSTNLEAPCVRPWAPPRMLCVLAVALLLGGRVVAQENVPDEVRKAIIEAPAAMHSITAEGLKKHLTLLASDAFEGRLTGTPGQLMTARYVADQFKAAGLEPYGVEVDGERTWFQGYPVRLRSLSKDAGLYLGDDVVVSGGAWLGLKPLDLSGPLQFVGTTLPRARSVDLDGRIAVFALKFKGSESRNLMGDLFAVMRQLQSAPRRLAQCGAKAAIIVTDQWTPSAAGALNMVGIFHGKPAVSNPAEAMDQMGMLGSAPIPTVFFAGEQAADILKQLGLTLTGVFGDEAEDTARTSQKSYRLKADSETVSAEAVNAVGLLRGSDPELSKELLVYSAHMDHVGMGPDGAPFNGADDNGSGTSTLMTLAAAYGSLPMEWRPRRSILFLSVSGEELGLWGSEAFASNPTWPLENIIADINIDMIGRSTEKVPADTISLTPTNRHKAYSSLGRDAASLGLGFGLKMTNGDRFYQRSDHYNFAKRGVPVVFFCDDEHEDYHMQTDDVEKIEFEKIERIARMAFLLGLRTANQDARPTVLGKRTTWFSEE